MDADCLVFVGSLNREAPYFQGARGKGLTVYALDEATGETALLAEETGIDNPTFLSVSAEGARVYASSEIFGWREGIVSAWRFDPAGPRLDYIDMQPTAGSVTAHNSLTRDGRFLLVANYAMGEGGPDQSVVAMPIRPDGGVAPVVAGVAHSGVLGPDASRQERSHAHWIGETVGGGLAVVADLGLDQLITYRIGVDGTLDQVAAFDMPPGAGPRHIAQHPNGRFLFVMNELGSSIAALAIDPAYGTLSLIDSQPAVPAEAAASNHCSDIQISPDGRFVYGANRGHDSIAIFAVDQDSGKLALVDYTPCGGATPRNLALSPSGSLLFSANQNADRITIFGRDGETGRLTDTGRPIAIGTPMCVKVVRSG
ncbi:MAG: lactonase family protein [Rhizobiales bacterium]|nr:lactonase family protein [Hyphomicrobiales bacterium]